MKVFDNPVPKRIIDLSAKDAKAFLMRSDCYFTERLPPYILFDKLLAAVDKGLKTVQNQIGKKLDRFGDINGVNHILYANKDSRFAWRQFQFIHPVLYIHLVNTITRHDNWDQIRARFKEFSCLPRITCASIPIVSLPSKSLDASQILSWWDGVEQESIRRAIQFSNVVTTDITDCYGTMYTHSVPWALHGVSNSKAHKNDKFLLGNQIDKCLRNMNWGQTNGIPQGSVIMNLIAELILGAIDSRLHQIVEQQKISDFEIVRYRDDYRIFVNDINIGTKIVRHLSEILREFGLRLNSAKTLYSDDVITATIKQDKLAWLDKPYATVSSLEKKLLLIYEHSRQFPNGGSILRALSEFNREIDVGKINRNAVSVIISVVAEIAFRNSRTYGVCMAITAKLLQQMPVAERGKICAQIHCKFSTLPNTGLLELWLQRICYPNNIHPQYNEKLCQIIEDPFADSGIWKSSPIVDLQSIYEPLLRKPIIDYQTLSRLSPVFSEKEVDAFATCTSDY